VGPGRAAAVVPLIGLAVTAWVVLVVFASTGNGTVIRHDRLLQGGPPLWLATLLFIGGWQVMLWAMMVPASLHAFDRVASGRAAAFFCAAYVAVWTAFGLLIFFFDAGVHATVNRWAWLASHSWLIAGTTLVVAGTYQLSDLKARSLDACRRLDHLEGQASPGHQGFVHALTCLGSGWNLMLLAFALAAGNLFTMASLTLLMVWEVTPWGAGAVKLTGYALLALGVVVMAGPIQAPLGWPV
jgi:predicted metal-binding membrane protein